MGSRRWVSWLAAAGMLLHAAIVARHNVIVFAHAISAQLAADVQFIEPSVICHYEGAAGEERKAQGPPGKSPTGGETYCPVCLGLASAHAMPASEAAVIRVPQTVIALAFVPRAHELAPLAAVRLPSARGPPSIA